MTPRSYLSFIAAFRDLYTRKLAHVRQLAGQIDAGLQKMDEAKIDVGRLKVRGCRRRVDRLVGGVICRQQWHAEARVGSHIKTGGSHGAKHRLLALLLNYYLSLPSNGESLIPQAPPWPFRWS